MEKSQYDKIASQALDILAEELEEITSSSDIETDLLGGILYINLDDKRQYVINKHSPSLQIWVSSPLSGASYYNFDQQQKLWLNKAQQELSNVVKQEICSLIQK